MFCKRKCKTDCNVGHMLVVGTVSIVMILIHQSRCTVCPAGLSVCPKFLMTVCQWEPVSLWETPTTLFPHQPRPASLSLHMVQKWVFLEYPASLVGSVMVWSHDRQSVMYSESRARYHDCILPLSHLNFQQQQAIISELDRINIHVSTRTRVIVITTLLISNIRPILSQSWH